MGVLGSPYRADDLNLGIDQRDSVLTNMVPVDHTPELVTFDSKSHARVFSV